MVKSSGGDDVRNYGTMKQKEQQQQQQQPTRQLPGDEGEETTSFLDATQDEEEEEEEKGNKVFDRLFASVPKSSILNKQQLVRNKKPPSKKIKPTALSNKLKKMLPDYVAPMKLETPSLDRYRVVRGATIRDEEESTSASAASLVSGLEALRRKAVQQDAVVSKNSHGQETSAQYHAQVMLQPPNSSSFSSSSYMISHGSFKKGRKRRPKGVSHHNNNNNNAGDGWFGMQPSEMTPDLERDLLLIRNRNYLDPKRFYKSADNSSSKGSKQPSKFVQSGTVIEGATEFYSARLSKRQRRGNLVDEVMAESSSSSSAAATSTTRGMGTTTSGSSNGSSADYVMKKFKNMQQESREKAQAWHKRNSGKGGRGARKQKR